MSNPKLLHVQTTVQTVFGMVDDGNVIPQQPTVITISRFTQEAFIEAFETIVNARDEALAKSDLSDES